MHTNFIIYTCIFHCYNDILQRKVKRVPTNCSECLALMQEEPENGVVNMKSQLLSQRKERHGKVCVERMKKKSLD